MSSFEPLNQTTPEPDLTGLLDYKISMFSSAFSFSLCLSPSIPLPFFLGSDWDSCHSGVRSQFHLLSGPSLPKIIERLHLSVGSAALLNNSNHKTPERLKDQPTAEAEFIFLGESGLQINKKKNTHDFIVEHKLIFPDL